MKKYPILSLLALSMMFCASHSLIADSSMPNLTPPTQTKPHPAPAPSDSSDHGNNEDEDSEEDSNDSDDDDMIMEEDNEDSN